LALAVSFSFIITSLLYRSAHSLYARWKISLVQFDRNDYLDNPKLQVQSPEVLVIGMGRVGTSTYNSLCTLVSDRVWGMDSDEEKVEALKNKGYRIFYGDGEDAELWESMNIQKIRLVLIALPYIQDIKNIREQLSRVEYSGKVAAIARFDDQMERLEETGIDKIFNFYNEAGVGFARESIALMQQSKI
jgi:Trk K+ transport system NAD-binding subunit